jgi:hypothetical protein
MLSVNFNKDANHNINSYLNYKKNENYPLRFYKRNGFLVKELQFLILFTGIMKEPLVLLKFISYMFKILPMYSLTKSKKVVSVFIYIMQFMSRLNVFGLIGRRFQYKGVADR